MKAEGEKAADPMPKQPQEPILLTADGVTAAPPALIFLADMPTHTAIGTSLGALLPPVGIPGA